MPTAPGQPFEFGLDGFTAEPARDFATLDVSLTGWFGRADRGRLAVACQTQLFRCEFSYHAVWLSAGWTF